MAQKHAGNKKWLWAVLGGILVAVLVTSGLMIWYNNTKTDNDAGISEDESSKLEEQEKIDGDQEGQNLDEEVVNQKKVVQYEGDDPNDAEELTGVVTYAGVNGSSLVVRTIIDQYLTEGTCELILSKNGVNEFSSATDIIGDVSTAMCNGYDLSIGQFEGGDYKITINLISGEKKGVIYGEVSI